MSSKQAGELVIVGGGEDKTGKREILKRICGRATREQAGQGGAGRGRLVIITAATREPEAAVERYRPIFKELGVEAVDVVDIRSREDAYHAPNVDKLRRADVLFFTGGSQRRIASQLGGTPLCETMQERFRAGATVAGTSAGAAAMPETMLMAGPSDESPESDELEMAPGLGLMHDMVIDSHFAQRGRIGRLVTAVGHNPRNLGLGIDEDTAVVMDDQRNFEVIGSGAVYVIDGTGVSYSSLAQPGDRVMSLFDLRLHLLAAGDRFEWDGRRPQRDDPEARGKRGGRSEREAGRQ